MKKLKLITLTLLLLSGALCLSAINELPLIAEFQGEHIKSLFGHQLVCLDFNHDGYDDLIVSSRSYGYSYPYTPPRGKVYVYYGGPGFSSNTAPAMSLEGDYPDGMQRVVGAIYNIGDVNGDGYDDLMITDHVPRANNSLRFNIFYGGAQDLSSPNVILLMDESETAKQIFKLGDIDGDGYDEVGIGYDIPGVGDFLDIIWGGSFERQNVLTLPRIVGYRDFSIVGLGDINNDGYHDFSVGYNDADGYSNIRVYYGNQDRVYEEYAQILHRYALWAVTRRCVPLGDLNNDGFADFMGWLPLSGDITVWLGSSSLPTMEPSLILSAFGGEHAMPPRETDSAGITYGDLNGDGYDDVIALGFLRFGVWLGGSNMNGYVDLTVSNPNLRDFPFVVAGDFNGDGFDDVAVSVPELRYDNYHPGYVYVYAGNPGLVTNDDALIPEAQDGFRLTCSPNPVSNKSKMKVRFSGIKEKVPVPTEISVYNLRGQLVYQTKVAQCRPSIDYLELDLTDYASGIYICQARIGSLQSSKRFTIIK
jgi:hypothetical protein